MQFVAIPPALNDSLLVRGESFLNQGVNRIHELQRLRLTRLRPTISTVTMQGEVMLITQEAGGSSYKLSAPTGVELMGCRTRFESPVLLEVALIN